MTQHQFEEGDVFAAFETDAELTDKGVLLDITLGTRVAARVRCRPADGELNPQFRKAMLELSEQIQKALRSENIDEISDSADAELLADVYARCIITEWNVKENGQPVPCDYEHIKRTLVRLPKFFQAIQRQARRWTNYRRQQEVETVKG